MANRRMFSISIVDSDDFLDMPASAQALYYNLGMRADDDGFINSARKIMKMSNCSDDDLEILVNKGYIISFENGIYAIRDWKINNAIKKDRYKPTIYAKEKERLSEDLSGAYSLSETGCREAVPNVEPEMTEAEPENEKTVPEAEPESGKSVPKDRLGKDRLGKDRLGNTTAQSEQAPSAPEPEIMLPLCDKTEYPVAKEQVSEWKTLYPGIDVMQELRNMRGWLLANPERRKTRRGILRFVTGWLSKSQNQSRGAPAREKETSSRSSYDFAAIEAAALRRQMGGAAP